MAFEQATVVSEVVATITTTHLHHTLREHQSPSPTGPHDPAAHALPAADSKINPGDLASGAAPQLEQRQAMQQVRMATARIEIRRDQELRTGSAGRTLLQRTIGHHRGAIGEGRALLGHRVAGMRVLDLAVRGGDRHNFWASNNFSNMLVSLSTIHNFQDLELHRLIGTVTE